MNLGLGYLPAWKPSCSYFVGKVDVQPLVHWYAVHQDGASRHSIDNSYHRYKAYLVDPDFNLAEGWTKTWNADFNMETVQHEKLLDLSFAYPFPIFPTVGEDRTLDFSHHLEFEAESCTLFLGASYVPERLRHPMLTIHLLDSRGR